MITAVCPKCGSHAVGMQAGAGGAEWVTLVGYYSPPGHDHDDNCRKRGAYCRDCEHRFTVSKRNRCPACDWEGKASCGCHDGPKVDEWPDGAA